MRIGLNNRTFEIDSIFYEHAIDYAKAVGKEMGLGFTPIATWFCDRKPPIKNVPRKIHLAPLVFFNAADRQGKIDPGKARRARASVFHYAGVRSTKELSNAVAGELGKAPIEVPLNLFRKAVNPAYRQVLGLYVYRSYFRVKIIKGPNKGAHFVMGLPLAYECGIWRVGICGTLIEEEIVDTAEGPMTKLLAKTKFVAGKYKKLKKATYHPLNTDGMLDYQRPDKMITTKLAEVFSPNMTWRAVRNIPMPIAFEPNYLRKELTMSDETKMDILRERWDRTKDGTRLLQTHG